MADKRGEWRVARATSGLLLGLVRVGMLTANIFTAGWLHPWLKSQWLRLVSSRLLLDGRKVRYDGSTLGVFAVWTRVWLLSVATLGVYYWFFGRGALDSYLDSRLSWKDEPAPSLDGKLFDDMKAFLNHKRGGDWELLSAGGGLIDMFRRWVGAMLVVGSFGLLWPWVEDARLRRWTDAVVIDGHKVQYAGSGTGIAAVWFKTWVLSAVTLGVYWWLIGRSNVHAYFDRRLGWASTGVDVSTGGVSRTKLPNHQPQEQPHGAVHQREEEDGDEGEPGDSSVSVSSPALVVGDDPAANEEIEGEVVEPSDEHDRLVVEELDDAVQREKAASASIAVAEEAGHEEHGVDRGDQSRQQPGSDQPAGS